MVGDTVSPDATDVRLDAAAVLPCDVASVDFSGVEAAGGVVSFFESCGL